MDGKRIECLNDLDEVMALVENKDVYIYGTGFCAMFLFRYLDYKGKRIISFVETKPRNSSVEKTEVIDVFALNEILRSDNNAICIIAMRDENSKSVVDYFEILRLKSYVSFSFSLFARDILDRYNEFDWKAFRIYGHLCDEESKLIYRYSCAAKLSCDVSYYPEMHKEKLISTEALERYDNNRGSLYLNQWIKDNDFKSEEIILYLPTPFWFSFSIDRVRQMGFKVISICTDAEDMQHKVLHKLLVLSPTECAQWYPHTKILIGCSLRSLTEKNYNNLIEAGIPADNIILSCQNKNPFCIGWQYFDCPNFPYTEDDVFVDVGGFDGETVGEFITYRYGKYKKIIVFEPDESNYKACVNYVNENNISNCEIIKKGLWSVNTTLRFSNNGTALSEVSDAGETSIEVAALDKEISDDVSFIKMDIEGSEMQALLGAKDMISRCKPKLAISIYHTAMDLLSIPEFLLGLVPEYKFYIRHYSLYKYETILYAFL